MKKIFLLSLTFLLLTCWSLAEAQTRPITFDDFIRIKRVSDPQVSPDGEHIAFVVTETDKERNTSNSDIWVVASRGGEPWKLTSSPKADFNPRWSPDGKKMAFISTRGGAPQIWTIDPKGGEALQLTSLSTGASGVIWSPTGTHLAFISSVYPDCSDDDCNKQRNEKKEKSMVKARIFDGLLFRHWNSWRDGERSHLFVIPAEGGKAVDITPGDFDTPPISLGSALDYAFSPDGKEVCFVRNIDPELKLALGTNNDLFTIAIEGKTISKITESKANDNSPRYSPDGKFIAYRAMARPGFEADKYSLILYDRKMRERVNLTESLDISINEALWSPDSSLIYITFEEKGRMSLARISVKTRKVEKVLDGLFISSPCLSPDGKRIVLLKQALNRPADIYFLELSTNKLVQLTDINRSLLSKLEMNPAEEFWFEGAEREKIHGFLLKPPFFDSTKKYPLVMLIHGGPQNAWSDNFHYRWNGEMFASHGYVIAMINFHGSPGYGQRFTDSISGDWGGKPFEDIIKGLDYLIATYSFIDKKNLAAAGASYGGYMIDWIEGHTDKFKCLVSHSGVFDLSSMHGSTEELWFPEWDLRGTPWSNKEMYEKMSPSSYVKNFKTPCLVVHSENDFRVPICQGFQFFTSLQRMGVRSRFLYFPDEDHFVQKPQNAELWWKTVLDWLAEYLKQGE
jgi:dipeptidyl aminopeptidase/acylaminoacyl peptidase